MNFGYPTGYSRMLLATASVIGLACPAAAQTTQQAAPPAVQEDPTTAAPAKLADQGTPAANGEQEIIVTAQKRAERVQTVPIPVQVLTGQALEDQGIKQFTQLSSATPSLLIRPAEHPVNASVSMRGIGTFAFSPSVEPSVAVQIDDVPVQFLARAFADLSDIDRIEVLRGPQSTLYGRSASAGLLNIVTRGPTAHLEERVTALATTDDQYSIAGALSGPITPNLGFRISGNYDRFRGNVHNLYNGDTVNGYRTGSIRGKLRWQPIYTLTIDAQAGYIDGRTTIGRPWIRVSPAARLRGNPAYGPSVFAPGVTFSEDNTDVVNDVTSGTKYTDFYQSLRASLDLGFASLVSITAWDHFKQFDILDQDESAIAALDNSQYGTFNVHTFSQELRLVSQGESPLRYTFGLFYSNLNLTRPFVRGPYFSQADWYATNGNKQYAAFGQAEYRFHTGTSIIGGLRYGRDKIDYTFLDHRAVAPAPNFFSGNDAENYMTYKIGLQQQFSRDVMGFLTHATGHKGQAYDIGTGFNLVRQQAGPVGAEKSSDWEAGVKSQFLDRRVTLNVTVFNTVFNNFQAQGIETLPDGTINFRLANVGKLRTRGIEVEGGVRPASDLNISGGVTYTDAKILSFPFAQCYPGQTAAEGCVGSPGRQDLAGYRPAQAPKWKLSLNGEYTPRLTSAFDGLLQANFDYRSTFNFGINNDPETVQKGYGIMNVSAGIRAADSKWEVAAFVNNLFNKHYFYNMANSRGNQGNVLAVQSYIPRDFNRYAGIRASYNF
jgi:iron complex outermembrane receptor protein